MCPPIIAPPRPHSVPSGRVPPSAERRDGSDAMYMSRAAKCRQFVKALVTRALEFEFERMPYRLEGISNTKLLALFRQELNCALPAPAETWWPVQLQIEPSSACTLHCPLCPSGTEDGGGSRLMPLSMFEQMMDEVGDHAVMAVFWMWGEPFVNPDLPKMIACAHRKNIGTVTSTNGQHIQTREEAERLVASGLDNVFIAVDGATQESYGRYRIGGKLGMLIRCLDMIREAKEYLGSATPIVNVRTVVTRDNEHELADIERIARAHGADMVSRKTAGAMNYTLSDGPDEFAPDDVYYRRYEYRGGKRVRKSAKNYRCRRMFKRMTVRSDGTMLACEFDHSGIAALGRYPADGSFMDIWKGQRAQAFRRQSLINRMVYPFCRECPFRDRLQSECTIEVQRLRGHDGAWQPSLGV
jgi:radical SAM protein with 4Fe4S-binding SPASM domain